MDKNLKLFSNYDKNGIHLKNRMIMAPMTRCRAIDNLPNRMMATYYQQRSGAGMIITEATAPSANGLGAARIPAIYSQQQIDGWQKVTDTVHERNSKIILQLMHTGRMSHHDNMPDGSSILAPSAVSTQGNIWTDIKGMQKLPVPIEMSKRDIFNTIKEFEKASQNAIKAGFDGVELHCSNGYLLNQFLNPASNHRTDEYGGNAQNQMRFIQEIINSVLLTIGKDRLGIRLSPWSEANGMELFEGYEPFYQDLCKAINHADIAYIHLVLPDSTYVTKNGFSLIKKIRNEFHNTLILNGGFDKDTAENAINAEYCDLISFGQAFLANPDLDIRFKNNLPLNKPDRNTFYSKDEKGYIDYPFVSEASH